MEEIFAVSIGIAICRISPMIELTGPMRGTVPWGSPSSIDDRRSPTICRARKISVLQLKVTYRNDRPALEADRTVSTPGSPFIAVSSGKVMTAQKWSR